jgi:hypothetical protein
MTCGGLKISDRFSVLTLALWLAVCSQGPTLAQTDKAHGVVTVLMPQPRSIDYGDGWLRVNGGFQVEWLGYRNSVLDRAVMRYQNDVARRTGLDVGRASAAQLRIDCREEDKIKAALAALPYVNSKPERAPATDPAPSARQIEGGSDSDPLSDAIDAFRRGDYDYGRIESS